MYRNTPSPMGQKEQLTGLEWLRQLLSQPMSQGGQQPPVLPMSPAGQPQGGQPWWGGGNHPRPRQPGQNQSGKPPPWEQPPVPQRPQATPAPPRPAPQSAPPQQTGGIDALRERLRTISPAGATSQSQQTTTPSRSRPPGPAAGTAVTDFRSGQDTAHPWNMAGQIGQPRYKPADWGTQGQNYDRDAYDQQYGTFEQRMAARSWANRQEGMFQKYGGEANYYNTPEYQAYLRQNGG